MHTTGIEVRRCDYAVASEAHVDIPGDRDTTVEPFEPWRDGRRARS